MATMKTSTMAVNTARLNSPDSQGEYQGVADRGCIGLPRRLMPA